MFSAEQLQLELDQLSKKINYGKTVFERSQYIEIGSCAKILLYEQNKLKLYYYPCLQQCRVQQPILICYALINRPTILDLAADCSFIGELLAKGHPVYLVDWGYPEQSDKDLSLDDYITRQLKICMQEAIQHSKQEKINLMGVCQGGVFSLCFASLYPKWVNKLITIATPIDFHVEAMPMQLFIQKIELDSLLNRFGNVPGTWFPQFFLSLKPIDFGLMKYLNFIEQLELPATIEKFIKMEKWIFDCPDQAGYAFKQFIQWFYRENKFITGKVKLGRRYVHFEKITMPILNIMAKHDHIVPNSSSKQLKQLIKHKQYTEYYFSGGHVGIFVSEKLKTEVTSTISQWIR